MATTYSYPVFIPYETGGRSTSKRSARDICENDYNKTEDPALSECMNEIVVERQHTDAVLGGIMVGIIAITILSFVGFIGWMIWYSRY